MKQHFDMIGRKGRDQVTGFKGVVTTLSFDLYGCVQVVLTPETKDGAMGNGQWFDVARIKLSGKKPVMSVPDFGGDSQIARGEKGAAPKPHQSAKTTP